jgi:DNA-3-methyladenine glycosylase II
MSKKAILHLSKDPVIKKLIKEFGEVKLTPNNNLFEDVVSSVISQQLSVKAASTIQGRFETLFGHFPTPEEIIKMDQEKIRACGISYPKVRYIKGIALAVIEKSINLIDLPNLPNEKVIEELVKLKGVGKWTAEMLLIFSLAREDVFSFGDLGLRTAVANLYVVDRDDLLAIEAITSKWSPYRSYASRYLWKSLDNSPK